MANGYSFEIDDSVQHHEIVAGDLCNPQPVAFGSSSQVLRAGSDGQFAIKVFDAGEAPARAEYDVLWHLSIRGCQGVPMAYCYMHVEDGLGASRPAIVMQYIDGTCLADVQRRDGALEEHILPMGPGKATAIASGLAELIDQLSKEGVVHGDISPHNVIVTGCADSALYLVDFGSARMYDPETAPCLRADGLLATVPYGAPELFGGEHRDRRQADKIDVYSLGAVLADMVAGERWHDSIAETYSGRTPYIAGVRSDLTTSQLELIADAKRLPVDLCACLRQEGIEPESGEKTLANVVSACTNYVPELRPPASAVARELESLVHSNWGIDVVPCQLMQATAYPNLPVPQYGILTSIPCGGDGWLRSGYGKRGGSWREGPSIIAPKAMLADDEKHASLGFEVLEAHAPDAIADDFAKSARYVGSGSFGSVWRAGKDGEYLIKCFFGLGLGYARREYEILVRSAEAKCPYLPEPVCLGVFADSIGERHNAIVIRNVDGMTLDRVQRLGALAGDSRENTLSTRQTVAVATGVARALSSIGENGIVHRDLSPSNVLLSKKSIAENLGEGAEVHLVGLSQATLSARQTVTLDEPHLATIPYGAPEVFGGEYYGARNSGKVDVWSLGALICTMIVGEYWPSEIADLRGARALRLDDLSHIAQAKREPIDLISLLESKGADVGATERELAKVVWSCTAYNPGHRPALGTVITMLEEIAREIDRGDGVIDVQPLPKSPIGLEESAAEGNVLQRGNNSMRIPVVLALDTSGSMGTDGGYIALNEAVASFYAACKNDAVNRYGYDVCVVTFGGDGVEVRQDFRPIWNQEQAPQFGRPEHGPYGTPLAHAVNAATHALEARREMYRSKHISCVDRAFLFIVTDGQSTELMRDCFQTDGEYERSCAMYEATAERARDLQREGRLEVACVGVGEQDYERLADFSCEGEVLDAKDSGEVLHLILDYALMYSGFEYDDIEYDVFVDESPSHSSLLERMMQFADDEGIEGLPLESFSHDNDNDCVAPPSPAPTLIERLIQFADDEGMEVVSMENCQFDASASEEQS